MGGCWGGSRALASPWALRLAVPAPMGAKRPRGSPSVSPGPVSAPAFPSAVYGGPSHSAQPSQASGHLGNGPHTWAADAQHTVGLGASAPGQGQSSGLLGLAQGGRPVSSGLGTHRPWGGEPAPPLCPLRGGTKSLSHALNLLPSLLTTSVPFQSCGQRAGVPRPPTKLGPSRLLPSPSPLTPTQGPISQAQPSACGGNRSAQDLCPRSPAPPTHTLQSLG